ncbi:MAG: baseplate J/gp47 family protein [Patescibacteria group bacterium]|nr:baseplate J/gp47 family protein [Patescibacteria group bacterium]
MPYPRPTLTDLKGQVASDIQSALPGSDPLLRFSNLNILGVALANLANAHYGYLDWIAKQSVPFTATDEYLYGWGALKGVTPIPASAASNGKVTFIGTNGTVIPDQTPLVRGDGATFTVQGAVTVSGGSAIVSATANTPGSAGNTAAASVMTLGTAIAGINSSGTVSTAFTNGLDVETVDAYRSRMLQVYQQPPQGGAASDYVTWASQVAGVTRAWCSPSGMGVGTVVVYVMMDAAESAHGGFPQGTDGVATDEPRGTTATGDQLAVANHIYALQPATALVYSVSPVANPINFTLSGLSGASSTVKAAISAAFTDVFTRNTILGGTVSLLDFETTLATIAGASTGVITSPAANIVSSTGYLPVLGTITYI